MRAQHNVRYRQDLPAANVHGRDNNANNGAVSVDFLTNALRISSMRRNGGISICKIEWSGVSYVRKRVITSSSRSQPATTSDNTMRGAAVAVDSEKVD